MEGFLLKKVTGPFENRTAISSAAEPPGKNTQKNSQNTPNLNHRSFSIRLIDEIVSFILDFFSGD